MTNPEQSQPASPSQNEAAEPLQPNPTPTAEQAGSMALEASGVAEQVPSASVETMPNAQQPSSADLARDQNKRESKKGPEISFYFTSDTGAESYMRPIKTTTFIKLEDDAKLLLSVGQTNNRNFRQCFKSAAERMDWIQRMMNKGREEEDALEAEDIAAKTEELTEQGLLRTAEEELVITDEGVRTLHARKIFSKPSP